MLYFQDASRNTNPHSFRNACYGLLKTHRDISYASTSSTSFSLEIDGKPNDIEAIANVCKDSENLTEL